MNWRTWRAWVLLCALMLMLAGCQQAVEPELERPSPVPTVTVSPEPVQSTPAQDPEPEPTAVPTPEPEPDLPVEPADTEFVRVRDYIPTVVVDLRYATEDNFVGAVLYPFSDAYLRYGTVKRLQAVQAELEEQGLGLKIWDAFRPTSAQFTMWDLVGDARYVANPNTGYSSHSRGNTVDVTLVDSAGNELAMPSAFDDFSPLADRDYSDVSPEAAALSQLLEEVMASHGMVGYAAEWWHYSDVDAYDVEEQFSPSTD